MHVHLVNFQPFDLWMSGIIWYTGSKNKFGVFIKNYFSNDFLTTAYFGVEMCHNMKFIL